MNELSCFKSYDVRGQLGKNLDEDIAYRIGRAFALVLGAKTVVCGRDGRESSPTLVMALANGLMDSGADVLDIGLCGTEEVYFATDHYGADGGIMVTASHNPIDYNGFKLVRSGARPLSADNGMRPIHDMAASQKFGPERQKGTRKEVFSRDAYTDRVLSFVTPPLIRNLNVVVNAGNGVAGPTFDYIAERLEENGANIEFTRVNHVPDATFPNGIPNPLLPENQPVTSQAVKNAGADFGVAWDGDFDRCFLFDEFGNFIDGEYIVGLLAAAFLKKAPGASIVHDARIMWNTQAIVEAAGGQAVTSKTGHPLMKQKMRDVDAIYGGEMSAHHYFRGFMYCDSGMIPWLLVAEFLSESGKTLSELVADMKANFPSSGEINFRVSDPVEVSRQFEEKYLPECQSLERLDGLSLDMGRWRVNLRSSNTEPLLRLNVESRGDRSLLNAKVSEIRAFLTQFGTISD
ncbi:phosphomannomutase [Algicella marina]|uniref:Phosphomannomutase n=1 Tax=Algicella marina TaxID=2683284 RepID=A0A6P1T1D8_9RHOB|nr:phosphomannomutase [Algicella marina]QHQ35266.1 phosphomannomutase [Algicella marina]